MRTTSCTLPLEGKRETPFGLRRCAAFGRAAVVLDRAGAGNENAIAYADRARKPELRFIGRPGEGTLGGHPQVISVIVLLSS